MASALRRIVAAVGLLALAGCAAPPPPVRLLTDEERMSPATLWPGDAAPPLAVQEWVRSPGPTEFQPGRVYLVDFWASWCGPCLAIAPHLTALARAHADALTVIAITTLDPDNSISAVRREARRFGPEVLVAIDDAGRSSEAYRVAVRDIGVPMAFVVDGEGRLAWSGHPIDAAPIVEAVIAGAFNLEASGREARARDAAGLATRRLAQQYLNGLRSRDSREQLAAAEAACAYPVDWVDGLSPPNWAWTSRVRLLAAMDRGAEASAVAREARDIDGVCDDPIALASMARDLVSTDPPVAVALARQAVLAIEALEGNLLNLGSVDRAEALPHASDGAAALCLEVAVRRMSVDPAWRDYLIQASLLRHAYALADVAAVEAATGRPERAVAYQRIAVERWPSDPMLRPTRQSVQRDLEHYVRQASTASKRSSE